MISIRIFYNFVEGPGSAPKEALVPGCVVLVPQTFHQFLVFISLKSREIGEAKKPWDHFDKFSLVVFARKFVQKDNFGALPPSLFYFALRLVGGERITSL